MATVQNVIDQIKWQTDLQQGGRLSNTDLIPEINDAYKIAHELFVLAFDDYLLKKTVSDFAVVGGIGANSISLVGVTDFFKLKAIQRADGVGGQFRQPLGTHEFSEQGYGAPNGITYRLQESTIFLEPELSCAGLYRVWYVYSLPDLTAVGDTITLDPNGMVKRFLVDYVGTRVMNREEDDAAPLTAMRNEMAARIGSLAAHRNLRGHKIADTRSNGRFRFMTRSGRALP